MRAMGLGLAGAHRTGKTYTARMIAERNHCPIIESSGTQVAKELGLKVDAGMDLRKRLYFQETVLNRFEALYEKQNGLFVADRTPIDFAAYTVIDWHAKKSNDELDIWVQSYVERCFDLTNRYFFHIGIIQPGIPYHEEPGKPAPRLIYQELVNTQVIGLAMDDAVRPSVQILPRRVTDGEERVVELQKGYNSTLHEYWQILEGSLGKPM